MMFKEKSQILIFLVIACTIMACSKKHNVEATVSGIGNDTIYIENYKLSNFQESPILDTTYSKNGKFSFNLNFNQPFLSVFTPKKAKESYLDGRPYNPVQNSLIFLLEPKDRISVVGNLERFNMQYKAKGSLFNESYSNHRNEYLKFEIEKSKIELRIDTLMFQNGDRKKVNTLFKKRKELSHIISNIQLEYIKKHTDKDLSAYYLIRQPLDTLAKYLGTLDASVKEGLLKSQLENQYIKFQKYAKVLNAEKNIKHGKNAPNFKLKSLSENDFLVDYSKNQYTVLDFWGSWCLPCIKGFPKMKEYYEKYKNNIEFIGIACHDSQEKLERAIEKYQLEWTNLLNDDNINKDVSVLFAIQDYPTKIIINSKGIIEGIFEGESESFYQKLEDLMASNNK